MKINKCWQWMVLINFIFINSGCNNPPTLIVSTLTQYPAQAQTSNVVTTTPFPTRGIPTSIYEGKPKEFILEKINPDNWIVYQSDLTPGLIQTSFQNVAIDTDGIVWVVGGDGLFKFDGKNWTTFLFPNELYTKDGPFSPRSISISRDHSVWLGGENAYLLHFDGVNWHKESINYSRVYAIKTAPNGDIWVAVSPSVVLKFDGKKWRTFTTENGLISNQVDDIAIDKNGTVWVVTNQGVSSYDGQNWTKFPMDLFCQSPCSNVENYTHSEKIIAGQDGSIWIAVENAALFHFISGQWKRYDNEWIFKNWYPIQNLCFSPNNYLWVGKWSLNSISLSYFDGKQWFVPYVLSDTGYPSTGQFNDISCAKDGSIWLVSQVGEIVHYIPQY